MSFDLAHRGRNVTAVLGPTNTGKTHLAIERMLGHASGLIGLPLRLLAREVYDKIAARIGVERVALITGEERISPERPRYVVCTVEAMPRAPDVDFLAIDEVQLAADPERGHVFTDRLLHARGSCETLLLGAQTMREAISDLIPGANFISRPRLSKLSYAGEKKITRLPARSAVVAFSAAEVYAIAELIRRQRGGAAVVLGALSPRTRNAQVALYQSGDVDFLVATDAIGMGLNLDVDHVAFAGSRKFDGQVHRQLTPAELAQIAGRAGRHMNDGTFGVTGTVEPYSADVIDRLETHTFEPVKSLQWRNRDLDFASLDRLRDSLREAPREIHLSRARMADDVTALESASHDPEVTAIAVSRAAIGRLWDVCQIPDYRKISTQNHCELVATLYKFLMGPTERIPADWFAQQVALADRTDGDIDTLANRIAHIRTWTFVSNRAEWLADPEHWRERTRAIEDALSDALHEQLTQRFVDRRTSALMRGLKDKDQLNAEIAADGAVHVERHFVGRLKGFCFYPDTQGEGIHGRATRSAAAHVLASELALRVRRVVAAKNDALVLGKGGAIIWRGEEIGRLEAGEAPLKPLVELLTDDHLAAADKEKVHARLNAWALESINERLKPLVNLSAAEDISGLARGIAFRLTENFGVLRREMIIEELKSLDQPARAQLRKYGVRFGAFNIYFPSMLKPSCIELAATLWMLKHGTAHGLTAMPELPRPGLTSVAAAAGVPEAFYGVAGFHVCGSRAVRIDMLERLADLIRPMLAWRAGASETAPKGATGDGGFHTTGEMMSILGCPASELGDVLRALGFWVQRRRVVSKAGQTGAEPKPPTPAPAADAAAGGDNAGSVAATPELSAAATPEPSAAADASAGIDNAGSAAAASESSAAATPEPLAAATPEPSAAATPEPSAVAPPEPLAAATPEPSATATPEPEGADAWEEVWRPRRKSQALTGKERQQRTRHRAHGQGRAKTKPPRRGEGGGRRDAGQRTPLTSTPATGAFDPDSPFAALRSLKAALEKRGQE